MSPLGAALPTLARRQVLRALWPRPARRPRRAYPERGEPGWERAPSQAPAPPAPRWGRMIGAADHGANPPGDGTKQLRPPCLARSSAAPTRAAGRGHDGVLARAAGRLRAG